MAQALVSARVDKTVLNQSKRMLAVAGMTVSDAIRNMLETMVATGDVGPWATPLQDEDALAKAKETTAFIEGLVPKAPQDGWGNVLVDKELLNDWREDRFAK